ncbi:MAG: ribonucleotide-diphosphate reductase subunit beta [Novosphingobium sp. 28-62-57]|uniref:50S ribosomal protein L11 methyltransferase n=1 Tax=unclassified Novosphingobium TaxID=2644732 RepID=UPI000BC6956F|nr:MULTISPECIES: 50S ribosomal protein L11 methyltransferase [unclassified Novosphingobium]OYW49811.1 MAG: ribonucleotide-diphosphate reductase subunit beta [Novosphingobium sp. 12-62-10]OYZ12233.1 MAG: ribonucleotide-diphosphate reductase subunit beta [Novosphingobium sp. 28-62-57]OZA31778.1 MAG: ribonucleotide-diphosphate reductase subunit beta [Novosphingobium sp. 17-62-9]HQS68886.1 50S ribosomal protein L11 methyltransferase [Novosphingobium sp.]
MSWKITAYAPREVVQAALVAHEDAPDWDAEIVIAGSEIAEDKPDDWQLEAWLDRKPTKADRQAIADLFEGPQPKLLVEELPEEDWVTLSQQGVEPIREGVFHVHTPEYPPLGQASVRDFVIPASQAFGTGQHATTAGCLAMLTHMKRQGVVVRNLADVGTGTGLLAFAAMHLWPRARAIGSDIDAVCAPVIAENAANNAVALGDGPGRMAVVIAAGMDHALLEAAGPYDLLIANILAGPLVELAADFSRAVVPGGSVLLAGLLETQEATVRAAYRKAGLRLAARMVRGDWSILWLRRRPLL